MKKIYCKNCKYYDFTHCNADDRHPLFSGRYKDHKGESLRRWRNSKLYAKLFGELETNKCSPNEKYACPLYQCKWHKFWVKPKRGPKHLLVELLK